MALTDLRAGGGDAGGVLDGGGVGAGLDGGGAMVLTVAIADLGGGGVGGLGG